MPRYLAVYTMQPEAVVRFRALPEGEQKRIDEAGLAQWIAWEAANAAAIVNKGGMVGRTTRIDRQGVREASNDICGYLIVEAESAEAAARLFENHPHFTVFPGDGVDIMPFVTEPPS